MLLLPITVAGCVNLGNLQKPNFGRNTVVCLLDCNFSIVFSVLGSRHSSSPNREGKNTVPIDYSKYVKRFSSSSECGSTYCKDLNYREHFHCLDCSSRVFVKKEEMIRHFKWHKKRDESLQHGFMRYSPMDDCSEKYKNCQHNRKQTHYHCVHVSELLLLYQKISV